VNQETSLIGTCSLLRKSSPSGYHVFHSLTPKYCTSKMRSLITGGKWALNPQLLLGASHASNSNNVATSVTEDISGTPLLPLIITVGVTSCENIRRNVSNPLNLHGLYICNSKSLMALLNPIEAAKLHRNNRKPRLCNSCYSRNRNPAGRKPCIKPTIAR
jgi:hypothetical protein